jgi:hypothetical protein
MEKHIPILEIEGIEGVRRPVKNLISYWLRSHELPSTKGLVLKVDSFSFFLLNLTS